MSVRMHLCGLNEVFTSHKVKFSKALIENSGSISNSKKPKNREIVPKINKMSSFDIFGYRKLIYLAYLIGSNRNEKFLPSRVNEIRYLVQNTVILEQSMCLQKF